MKLQKYKIKSLYDNKMKKPRRKVKDIEIYKRSCAQ